MKLAIAFAGLFLGGAIDSAWSQTSLITRVSLGSGGSEGDFDSLGPAISADGRYVAFESAATNLVSGDTNGWSDVFVRDRSTGQTLRVSVDSAGGEGSGSSSRPSISAGGRYVAFESSSDDLVPGDTNGWSDVFVHDVISGQTTRVSVDSSGNQGSSESGRASISADGRFVAFESGSANLVAGDTNNLTDVFVHDRIGGQTTRASVDSAGSEADAESRSPAISADGRYVAFQGFADNLVAGDTNGWADVFVHDLVSGQTARVSVDSAGGEGDYESRAPSISADGRFVAFESDADDLVAGDTNSYPDVFVHDRLGAQTTRVSLDSAGNEGDSASTSASISADARYVSFHSTADNLVPGDTNGWADVFLRDRLPGMTLRVSVDSSLTQGDSDCLPGSALSSNSRYAVFASTATNLVPGDTNTWSDVFVCDLFATSFSVLCDAGLGGTIACPCANPPASAGRGCDNSSVTGGAVLFASGTAYLAQDSLVFTTGGEKPSATSILLQGNAELAAGVAFGQGVRCAGGTLRRLFTKTAVAGSILAPNFGAGDPSVSARSAALGDAIQGGQSRWYLVYYRDPIVLGGCPATSTFNATQTGRVAWSL